MAVAGGQLIQTGWRGREKCPCLWLLPPVPKVEALVDLWRKEHMLFAKGQRTNQIAAKLLGYQTGLAKKRVASSNSAGSRSLDDTKNDTQNHLFGALNGHCPQKTPQKPSRNRMAGKRQHGLPRKYVGDPSRQVVLISANMCVFP